MSNASLFAAPKFQPLDATGADDTVSMSSLTVTMLVLLTAIGLPAFAATPTVESESLRHTIGGTLQPTPASMEACLAAEPTGTPGQLRTVDCTVRRAWRIPYAVPACTLTASPTSITAGQPAVLTWVCANSNKRTASGGTGFTGGKSATGTSTVRPTATTTYRLAFEGQGGADAVATTVTVTTAAPTPIDATCEDLGWKADMPPSCTGPTRTFNETRAWRTVTPAQNGGKACPATETRPVTEACQVTGNVPTPAQRATSPRFTQLRIVPHSDRGAPASYEAAFRITCAYSHMNFDDPIVHPRKPGASHLHTWFGNTSGDANSTLASLLASNSSTCAGGPANKSNYWVPSVIDPATNTGLVPDQITTYYKATSQHRQLQLPNGLKLLAGDPNASAERAEWESHYVYGCESEGYNPRQSIPRCRVGDRVAISLQFPNCWNGNDLDSPDHRSHMAYQGDRATCPASHPVPIPIITFNLLYRVKSGQDSSKWRLSSDTYSPSIPGGRSMHGDAFIAWEESIKEAFMNNCLRQNKDCHSQLLGDGRYLAD